MRIAHATEPMIILPHMATHREQFAAQELCKYLNAIFGICPTVCGDDTVPSGDLFLIGGPARNAEAKKLISEAEFDRIVPGPEGMMVRTFGKHILLLAGSSKSCEDCERGTIYAVYEFLEQYLGVSLAAYGNPEIAGGEHIPTLDEAELTDILFCKPCSDSIYRTAIVQYADAAGDPNHGLNLPFLDWLAKNRYNRILTWSSIYEGYKKNGMLEEAKKRGIRFTVGHHESSQLFLPPEGNAYFPERYYATHPEYYKLLSNGERFHPNGFYGQWIFCSRNEVAISQIAKNIIKWIFQNPTVDIIAFWPQDGIAPQCTCPLCAPYSKVSNYTYFLNHVSERVREVHPQVKIDMLVYVDLWECPDGQHFAPNMIVDESTWHDSGLRHVGKPDGSGIIGTFFEENLLKWQRAGAKVVYYDYYMGVYPARQRYIPMADEISSLSRHFAKSGVMGTGTQIECFNLWNHIFNFYTFARSAYDNGKSMSDHLTRFLRIFGAGATAVEKIILEAEACLDGQAPIDKAGLFLMEHIDKERIYAFFEDAYMAAELPGHRNNIRMMRMAFRYSELECQEALKKETEEYASIQPYEDLTGELFYISRHFDSFHWNNPGFGITIPVDCPHSDYLPGYWYTFEA